MDTETIEDTKYDVSRYCHDAADVCVWIERWIDNQELKHELITVTQLTETQIGSNILYRWMTLFSLALTIYTDSQAAIHSINRIQYMSTRKWLKRNDVLILIKVALLLRKKKI
ncbi:hypothetical protein RhiirC2_728597, partial [Rhizophagus irregularis]